MLAEASRRAMASFDLPALDFVRLEWLFVRVTSFGVVSRTLDRFVNTNAAGA
jgi:hypothetical protein